MTFFKQCEQDIMAARNEFAIRYIRNCIKQVKEMGVMTQLEYLHLEAKLDWKCKEVGK